MLFALVDEKHLGGGLGGDIRVLNRQDSRRGDISHVSLQWHPQLFFFLQDAIFFFG